VTTALLSLGSNLGDRHGYLRAAVDRLAADGLLIAASDVYETPPWGDPDQPAYLNAAAVVRADVPATAWLRTAQALEREAKRERDPARPFGPRTLDVDVIAVWTDEGGDVVSDDPELTLPHPRAHLRTFVLRPWLDLMPDARVPGHGSVAELLDRLGEQE
jgi:2-amino-4-hydroxy-6-hydroxymethyldihydropteridine diphosphokinase